MRSNDGKVQVKNDTDKFQDEEDFQFVAWFRRAQGRQSSHQREANSPGSQTAVVSGLAVMMMRTTMEEGGRCQVP